MTAERSFSVRLLGCVPVDLAMMAAVTILVNIAVFAPIVRTTPLRVPLGILFAFFVPGYALAATLFPGDGRSVADADPSSTTDNSRSPSNLFGRTRIAGIERVVLSFGLSTVIIPCSALVLNYTSWGIRPVSVLAVTTVLTLLLIIAATIRRLRLPEEQRFRIPVRNRLLSFRDGVSDPADRAETILTLLLVLSVLLAAGGVGYAVTAPQDGERFSEVYLLSQDDGELTAGDYPTEFERGESQSLVVGVENNEHRTTNYTVIAVEQSVESNGSEAVVTDQRKIDRFEIRLDHGETWQQERDVEPTMAGENVRLVWLVYLDGNVPDSPSMDNAAYQVHLWADINRSTSHS